MNSEKVRNSMAVTGIAILVIVAIPVLVAFAFFYRLVLFAAIGVGLAGIAIATVISPRARTRVRSLIEPEMEYKGIRLATEVCLGPGHSWARVARDGTFIGIDDLVGKCVGPIERVELPAPGQVVEHGDPLFAVARGNRFIQARSPVDGTVLATNENLRTDPERVNRDPYGLGWIVRVRNERPRRERRRLLHGVDAERWFRHEVDRFVALVGGTPSAMASFADGGVIAERIDRLIDETTWQRLRSDLFRQNARKEIES